MVFRFPKLKYLFLEKKTGIKLRTRLKFTLNNLSTGGLENHPTYIYIDAINTQGKQVSKTVLK